jgi:hypothetical protein
MFLFDTPPLSVPPTIPPGSHTIQRASEHTIRITDPLPHTGAGVLQLVLVAVLIVAIGVMLIAAARTRDA